MSRSSRSEFVRKCALAIAPVAMLLAGAGTANASTKQEMMLYDDRVFASTDALMAIEGFNTADALGVDTIHSVINWAQVAPGRKETRKPSFNAADPKSYPPANWDRWDTLVTLADERGLDVLLSPAGPIPRWAGGCAPERDPNFPYNCRPDPDEYELFVTAVAKRYSGKYRDEITGRTLPKVDRFSLWNEPNEPGWIQPDDTGVNAGIYRELVYAGIDGLKKGGQGRAQVLLGETAPLKNSLLFWQNLFCIDSKGAALKGGAAKKADCKPGKRPKKFDVDGVGHHPYDRGGKPPFKKPKKNDINLAGMDKLDAVLALGAKAKVIKRNIPIYVTEFGVSTKPEDRKFGVSYKDQAEAINRAEYEGYKRKNIRSWTQYQLDNDAALQSKPGRGIFQTGIRFQDVRDGGKVKEKDPSFDAFRMPLYVTGDPNSATVWGGVRPGKKKQVAIQVGKGKSFKTVKTVTVDKYGYINQKKIEVGKGKLVRLEWKDGAETFYSRDATVEKE